MYIIVYTTYPTDFSYNVFSSHCDIDFVLSLSVVRSLIWSDSHLSSLTISKNTRHNFIKFPTPAKWFLSFKVRIDVGKIKK